MHAVWPLIHQDRDRSVGPGVGNVLCHFFHDERIADQKAHDLWRVDAALLAQNCAEIEFHEQHQPRPAEATTDRTFQLGKGSCTLGRLPELGHIRTPNCRFQCRHDRLERLGRHHAEPLDLDLSAVHVFVHLALKASGPAIRSASACARHAEEGPAFETLLRNPCSLRSPVATKGTSARLGGGADATGGAEANLRWRPHRLRRKTFPCGHPYGPIHTVMAAFAGMTLFELSAVLACDLRQRARPEETE